MKRATIYLDADLHRALKLKAAATDRTLSDIVNEAVRRELSEDADDLAATWMGYWQVVWVDGLEQCRRVDVALETPDAARVVAEALRAWSVSEENAVVEELSSGLVRLTVCAPRPPPPAGSVSPA